MDTELLFKYNRQLRRSDPIEYQGIRLYPVLYKDNEMYNMFIRCLTYNPIYFEDVALSSLPRLYFITSVLNENFEQANPLRKAFFSELCGLLKLVLREQEFDFVSAPANQIALSVCIDKDNGTKVQINAKKFEEMRRIILLQNDTYCEDRYIHPDILRWIEEQKERERKHTSQKYVETPEDLVETLMMGLHQTDEHFVDDMSIRRVNRVREKILNQEVYNAQMIGSMSGMVKFKESPVSWAVTRPKQTDFDKYLRELHPEGAPTL